MPITDWFRVVVDREHGDPRILLTTYYGWQGEVECGWILTADLARQCAQQLLDASEEL